MNRFLNYVLQRVAWAVPVLLGASFVAFIMIHLAPGDPARIMLGERATPEQIARLRSDLGLNQPLYIQYWEFLKGAATGDLGQSIQTQKPVLTMIFARIPYTIQLATASLLVAISVALPAGVIGATRKGTGADQAGRIGSLLGISIPNFWLGLVLLLLFAVQFRIFPLFGMTLVTEDPVEGIISTVLPAIALGTALAAQTARLLRGGMIDELGKEYVQTAEAYGISESEITYVYVLKNAFIPVLTVIGLQLGYLIGGSVVIEQVFGIPGVGRLSLNSIFAQDFPVIQGVVLLVAVAFVVTNLVVDLLYALLDPRIRYGGESS